MITEKQYRNAIETIRRYREQIDYETSYYSSQIEKNPRYLLKKGQKIRLTRVAHNSTSSVGDIVEVLDCNYNDYYKTYPIAVFKNKNGYKSRICKTKNWDYEVLKDE